MNESLTSPGAVGLGPSRQEILQNKNRRLGLLIFQISWMMTFVCFSVVNWQLRWQYIDWPPPEISLGRTLPTIATLVLLLSALLLRSARLKLSEKLADSYLIRWRLAIALGAAFVIIMGYEFWRAPSLSGTTYRDVFRVMTGFHLLHALVIGTMVLRAGRQWLSLLKDAWALEAANKLWNFVFVAWLIFYAVLYWI